MNDAAQLTIRTATEEDADRLAALLTDEGYPAGPSDLARRVARFGTADSRVLVAGDALTNTIDGLKGPISEATDDLPTAEDSVRKLAALEPHVILVGHGPPVQRNAAAQLRRLASSQ